MKSHFSNWSNLCLYRLINVNFLGHRIRISAILSWVRNSFPTDVILPRLSREDCLIVVFEVKMTSSCDIASQRIHGRLEAYFKIKSQL